jgi:hypothetical protein
MSYAPSSLSRSTARSGRTVGGIGECNLPYGWWRNGRCRGAKRIDMGIDVLQALQFSAKGMDPRELKRRFGDRLCFEGGVSVQTTLPFGTEDRGRRATGGGGADRGAGRGWGVHLRSARRTRSRPGRRSPFGGTLWRCLMRWRAFIPSDQAKGATGTCSIRVGDSFLAAILATRCSNVEW